MKDFRVNSVKTCGGKQVKYMCDDGEGIDNHDWEILKKSSGLCSGFVLCQCEDEFAVLSTSCFNTNCSYRWIRRYLNLEDALQDYAYLTNVDMSLLMNGR